MNNQTVGFIGLGRMGAGMAKNLLGAGVPLLVYDISQPAVASLVAHGAQAAANPAELAAKVERLFICLPFTPEVEATLFGDDGVLHGANPGLAIVDNTTLHSSAAISFAERIASAGHEYSDCPVSGMPARANNGTLTIMFGGTNSAFDAAKPYLDIMGGQIIHCGDIGMGQVTKAINNIIYNINIAGLCEIMPLAIKAGLSPETVLEVVTTGSSRSFASEYFAPRILDRIFEFDYSLEAAYKDIENIQEVATSLQASIPVTNAMITTYQQAMTDGYAEEPKSAMVKVYEKLLGVEVRRDKDSSS